MNSIPPEILEIIEQLNYAELLELMEHVAQLLKAKADKPDR
ncbi:hypothetical protein [Romeriopsis navalis]|nr:hypothetical protein [Romeriopsis navalis]